MVERFDKRIVKKGWGIRNFKDGEYKKNPTFKRSSIIYIP